ncbi:MAG: exodeoxyribonuclease VII small subunit, partial [Actinobacteria bacterium]|nr:exodeoxyribonuclease VII small subunit [Actinomycetota bacterium]
MGNEPRNFADVRERLEDIVVQVRSKELSLEKSLDLYEEAIRLGNCALTFVYKPEFSPEEAEILQSVRDSTSAIADSISEGRDGFS